MENISLILSIMLVHLLAVVSPGPDFVMVLKNALTYSRKIGVYTAIGIGLGIIVHISYTFLGVGVLIKKTPALFNLLKYLGGFYIVYMGIKSFNSTSKNESVIEKSSTQNISKFKALQIGFVTNTLNPKVSLFFLSLFTLVLKPNTPISTLVIIAILIVLQTSLWFVVVSYFFTYKSIQKKYYQYQESINKIFGVILIALAIKIIFFS